MCDILSLKGKRLVGDSSVTNTLWGVCVGCKGGGGGYVLHKEIEFVVLRVPNKINR